MREKMQNEMLKVDSTESSAQEGHTYAVLQGVGQCAVLRLAQGSQLLPKKTRSTTPPFSHGAEIVTVATDTNCFEVKLVKRNIGNIWLQLQLLQLRRKQ